MAARKANTPRKVDPEVKELLKRIYGGGGSESDSKTTKAGKKK